MLRFASYLSSNIYDTYASIARYVGNVIGLPTTLTVGQSFDEIGAGQVDIAFMCGLPYATMVDSLACPFELLAAPVLLGERYQQRPIYFSDVIVRQESPYTSFDVLEGRADAAAIDSQVLDVFLASNLATVPSLRVIAMLGPSSAPPVVIARKVNRELKRHIQAALLSMHEDPFAAKALQSGAMERFVPVSDAGYQDIRAIRARVNERYLDPVADKEG